jgi:hypothetical protein
MAAAATVTKKKYDGKQLWVYGTVALSGSYTQGGDTLSLAGIGIQSSLVPFAMQFESQAGTAAQAINQYTWVPGTTQANGKIRCFIGAVAELAAGAYPAAATGDTISFMAQFDLR